jgi:hypothetical protein
LANSGTGTGGWGGGDAGVCCESSIGLFFAMLSFNPHTGGQRKIPTAMGRGHRNWTGNALAH